MNHTTSLQSPLHEAPLLKPPSSPLKPFSSLLKAPFKPFSSPLQALFKALSKPLRAPLRTQSPKSTRLQAPPGAVTWNLLKIPWLPRAKVPICFLCTWRCVSGATTGETRAVVRSLMPVETTHSSRQFKAGAGTVVQRRYRPDSNQHDCARTTALGTVARNRNQCHRLVRGPLGLSTACSATRSMPSTPLPSRYESAKQEEAQVPKSESNASDLPPSLPQVLPPDPFTAHHCNWRVNQPSRRKSPCPNWSQMPGDHWVFLPLALPDPSQHLIGGAVVQRLKQSNVPDP